MHNVLLTGITGFLGSHIAEILIKNNVKVTGLRRPNSDIWRCREFADDVHWIDMDEDGRWKKEAVENYPSSIIHCAWMGVEASDRDDWSKQAQNINFLVGLLEIAKGVDLKQIIFLGSQAEYGVITSTIDETSPAVAHNAYASLKLACLEILKTYSELNGINWLWLRVFSVFGERENENWLIPSVIKKLSSGEEMNFTAGEQKYAYLYVRDFSEIVYKLITNDIKSGIYNISANEPRQLRTIIELIATKLKSNSKLNFGIIPYRDNQSMHIEGDISKLTEQLGSIRFENFSVALQNTIDYYTLK